jgi:hypothetical protein
VHTYLWCFCHNFISYYNTCTQESSTDVNYNTTENTLIKLDWYPCVDQRRCVIKNVLGFRVHVGFNNETVRDADFVDPAFKLT